MGRKIRRVIPNWEHPKDERGYKPLYDRGYSESIAEWISGHLLWEKGGHPVQQKDYAKDVRSYEEWSGRAPSIENHRPDWKPEEATWYQLYETVSEGTPVTPPFETQEELIRYLAENGDFWDQKRRTEGRSLMPCQPWGEEKARRFVMSEGWAPSFVMTPETGFVDGVTAVTMKSA